MSQQDETPQPETEPINWLTRREQLKRYEIARRSPVVPIRKRDCLTTQTTIVPRLDGIDAA